MGDLLIRGIPEPLKTDIAQAASKEGTSLSAKAIELLRKGMIAENEAGRETGRSALDSLRSIFAAHDAIGDEFAEIMDEIEAARKTDFGRPLPDFE